MDDLEQIKAKVNIVDLIQEYIPLKKSGVNFKANCPFHEEKTPSFMVSPERQIFKCFGCGKGGDIFRFLMEKEGVEFKEALELLAKRAGIVLKNTSNKKDSRDRLFEANLKAQEFFHYLLVKHPLGKVALKYLKDRGLQDETIESFGLGYAPDSWDSLTKFLLKRGFNQAELVISGLAVASRRMPYDRFRGRIIFPLIDQKDRIIGFSGRVLGKGEPKYINTPQTSVFDKSQFLFGIHKSKSEIKIKKQAILMEGEMDVILSFQAGIKNVVASKGTALTSGQTDLIKKYTDNIILCFDTDLAGDMAARRGIEIADEAGLSIKVIKVEGGKDPAEIVLQNPQKWADLVEKAIPIYDYYLESASSRYDSKEADGVKHISEELIPIISKISDDLVRDHYIQKLASLIRADETLLRSSVDKQRRLQQSGVTSTIIKSNNVVTSLSSRREMLEEYLLSLLLHIPKDHQFFPSFPETLFTQERFKQIFVLLVLYLDSISFKGKAFSINEFASAAPKEAIDEIDRLYLTQLDERLIEKEAWQKEIEVVVGELKKALVRSSLEKLSLEIRNAQEFGKMEMLESLNKRFRDLSLKLKNL